MRRLLKAKDLRKSHKQKKQPCFICGKHSSITELHHVLSLEDCAAYLNTKAFNTIEVPTVWLCPNHHAYMHTLYGDGLLVFEDGFNKQEWDLARKLINARVDALETAYKNNDIDRAHNIEDLIAVEQQITPKDQGLYKELKKAAKHFGEVG